MKKSEIVAALIMAGMIIFAGLRFGEKNISQKKLNLLSSVSSQLASGKSVSKTDQNKIKDILPVSSFEYVNESPAHAGIFVSIIKRLSFLFPKLKSDTAAPLKISRWIYNNYLKIINLILNSKLYLLAAGLFFIMLVPLLDKMGLHKFSSFTGNIGFFLSRILLSLMAGLLLAAWILIKSKFWIPVNISIFGPPALFLILTSLAVKMHDPNFPLWNRILKNLILPLVMSFVIVGNSLFFVEASR